ncbi:MAG: 1-acyl-sn-glycerol-3-phosphate acyltransferase [Actinophytocola sp.]|nr:1-acyl-sn-glycerol-3-phosphate acyltransferase [Actinophytocola sp.]
MSKAPVPTRSLPQPHRWLPTSPCGPGCLDAGVALVGWGRALLRIVAASAVLVATVLGSPVRWLLPGAPRQRIVRWVFVGLLRAFGIRLIVHGGAGFAGIRETPGRGALVASNHISWLDIVAVNAVQPMRALAKSEIARWPVLGGLARRAGTIFVDRARLSALPGTVGELAAALRAGSLINVSAEGTTWCGRAMGPFVAAPFQAAIDGGVPVRPVALRYRTADGTETTYPAFIGTESFLASLGRVARLRGLVVEVFVCDEIAPGRAENRRELARLAEAAAHSALGYTAYPPVEVPRRRAMANGTRGRAGTVIC